MYKLYIKTERQAILVPGVEPAVPAMIPTLVFALFLIRILLYLRIAMGTAIVSFDLAKPLNEQYNSSDLES